MGGLGGIVGSTVFRSQDAPSYYLGMYAAISCNICMIIVVGVLALHFLRQNRLADRYGAALEGLDGFRYTY
jgi:hypothetical protein